MPGALEQNLCWAQMDVFTFSVDSKLMVWNLMTPVLGSVTSLYMLMFSTTPLTWQKERRTVFT